jgi:hypothetical protein
MAIICLFTNFLQQLTIIIFNNFSYNQLFSFLIFCYLVYLFLLQKQMFYKKIGLYSLIFLVATYSQGTFFENHFINQLTINKNEHPFLQVGSFIVGISLLTLCISKYFQIAPMSTGYFTELTRLNTLSEGERFLTTKYNKIEDNSISFQVQKHMLTTIHYRIEKLRFKFYDLDPSHFAKNQSFFVAPLHLESQKNLRRLSVLFNEETSPLLKLVQLVFVSLFNIYTDLIMLPGLPFAQFFEYLTKTK